MPSQRLAGRQLGRVGKQPEGTILSAPYCGRTQAARAGESGTRSAHSSNSARHERMREKEHTYDMASRAWTPNSLPDRTGRAAQSRIGCGGSDSHQDGASMNSLQAAQRSEAEPRRNENSVEISPWRRRTRKPGRIHSLADLSSDLRYASRALRRDPDSL